ncbi:MAG: NAD(P)-dependent oxidoreductase, partial [Burkholderiales bacterium]
MRIGFIGLGIMGKPMALNLLKGGHSLSVYARREASMVPLREAGAETCASPREVARAADISFVMVSDTADVEHVVLGENGFLHGARAGPVLADMSTIAPANTRLMAE